MYNTTASLNSEPVELIAAVIPINLLVRCQRAEMRYLQRSRQSAARKRGAGAERILESAKTKSDYKR